MSDFSGRFDEPSTGLDPGARSDLRNYLREVRTLSGVTIVLTTHLLEEAERADRIAILSAGQLVALGAPDELRATVGGRTLVDKMTLDDPKTFIRPVMATYRYTKRPKDEGLMEKVCEVDSKALDAFEKAYPRESKYKHPF